MIVLDEYLFVAIRMKVCMTYILGRINRRELKIVNEWSKFPFAYEKDDLP